MHTTSFLTFGRALYILGRATTQDKPLHLNSTISRILSWLIIDKTDRVLAQHYGFTDEELDFIINYDIKYRMGMEVKR